MARIYRAAKNSQGKVVNQHRLLMERHLGRRLTKDEVVHHINHDKRDNRIENLMVMTHQEHSAHHNQKHPISKDCEWCGTTYEPHPTKRKRSKSCSKECQYKLVWRTRRSI